MVPCQEHSRSPPYFQQLASTQLESASKRLWLGMERRGPDGSQEGERSSSGQIVLLVHVLSENVGRGVQMGTKAGIADNIFRVTGSCCLGRPRTGASSNHSFLHPPNDVQK